MNLDNLKRSSRVFAAGLCGAAVLTFTALDQQAQAQDQPEEPQTQERVPQEDDTEVAGLENENPRERETNHEIDLSDVSFEAEVVRTVGNSALIVQADEKEFLLPRSVITLASEKSQELGQNDEIDAEYDEDNEIVGAGNEVEVEADVATDDNINATDTNVATTRSDVDNTDDSEATTSNDTEVANTNDDQVITVESDKSDNYEEQSFKAGDKVRVSFTSTDAELVALENKVLTVRTQDSVMQLPAEALSSETTSKVAFIANIDGEKQIMTLQEALDDDRKLSVSQDWPTKLPQDAEAGVIVANNPGRLLLATVGNDKIELIQVPQSMQAGEAVSLKTSDEGNIAVSPLDGMAGMIAYEKTEFKGTLLSQNSDFIVLESGEHYLVLPAGLELTEDEQNQEQSEDMKTDRQVTVTLPAGNAEMVGQHEDNAVLETKHGMAQLPLELLNQNEDNMQSVDVSSKTESNTVTTF